MAPSALAGRTASGGDFTVQVATAQGTGRRASSRKRPLKDPGHLGIHPALAQERLTRRADGLLQLEFKRSWKDGTQALVFEPHEFISRLVAMVPPPRAHQLRYWGVLSSHSALRSEVVPQPTTHDDAHHPAPAEGDQLGLFDERSASEKKGHRHRWSWLLAHVFRADLETCPRCGGPMRWAEVATGEAVLPLLIEHGLAPRAPPPTLPAPLGQLELGFAG